MNMKYVIEVTGTLYRGAGVRLKLVVRESDGIFMKTVGSAEKFFEWSEVCMDTQTMTAWVLEEARRIVRDRQVFVVKREAIEQRLKQAIEGSEFELLDVSIGEVY